MTDALNHQVRTTTNWSIAMSVLMIVVGIFAIGLPMVAGVAVTSIIGWLLLFSGALHIAFAWRAHDTRGVLWEILVGVTYGVIGFFLIARPMVGLASLTLAVGIYLLVEGILELVLSVQLRYQRGAGWLLFDGIVTLFLAVIIGATWPSNAVWVIGVLIGVSMLFSGISRLMLSLAMRRIVA